MNLMPYYRAPSCKRLQEAFGVDESTAKHIRRMLHGDDACNVKDWRKNVDAILEAVDEVIDGFGIESINYGGYDDDYYGDIRLLYVNRGDTYTPTLCYEVETDRFLLTSYGDWCEAHYREIEGGI